MASAVFALATWIAPAQGAPAIATVALPTGAAPPVPRGARNVGTTFRVARRVGVTRFALYDGPDGGAARRAFEGVKERGEVGDMTFEMNDGARWIVRATYTGKSK